MLHHSVDLKEDAAKRFRQEPEGAEMQERNAKEMLVWEKSSLKWKSILASSTLDSTSHPSIKSYSLVQMYLFPNQKRNKLIQKKKSAELNWHNSSQVAFRPRSQVGLVNFLKLHSFKVNQTF